MWQNAPVGASHKRVRRHAEHDIHLGVVDLDTADERANDFTAGEPIGGLEPIFHLSGEVFQPTNQQQQLALDCLRVGQLTHLIVKRDDALALPGDA